MAEADPLRTEALPADLAADPFAPQPGQAVADSIMVALAGRGLADVIALRLRQIEQFGHTLQADLARLRGPEGRRTIARDARRDLDLALEDMHFNQPRAQIRKRMIRACAQLLAAIDAEDALAATEEASHG